MPALHRKTARMRLESIGTAALSSAPSSSALSSSTPSSSGDAAQEKLYTNSDMSKMIKEAVLSAVCQTKDKYEKILQEKLAGQFVSSLAHLLNHFNGVFFCRTIPTICAIQRRLPQSRHERRASRLHFMNWSGHDTSTIYFFLRGRLNPPSACPIIAADVHAHKL